MNADHFGMVTLLSGISKSWLCKVEPNQQPCCCYMLILWQGPGHFKTTNNFTLWKLATSSVSVQNSVHSPCSPACTNTSLCYSYCKWW